MPSLLARGRTIVVASGDIYHTTKGARCIDFLYDGTGSCTLLGQQGHGNGNQAAVPVPLPSGIPYTTDYPQDAQGWDVFTVDNTAGAGGGCNIVEKW